MSLRLKIQAAGKTAGYCHQKRLMMSRERVSGFIKLQKTCEWYISWPTLYKPAKRSWKNWAISLAVVKLIVALSCFKLWHVN